MTSFWIDPVWIAPAVALALALAGVLSWSYLSNTRYPLPARLTAFACKSLAFLLVLFCLLNPVLLEERPEKQSNYWLIVSDSSVSMNEPAGDNAPSATATKLLTDPQASLWIEQLREDFRVRSFAVGQNISTTSPGVPQNFDQAQSNLGLAFDQLRGQFENLPVAGILLFSDGVATDDLEDLSGLPPVYPVDLLPDSPPRDLAIQSVTSDQTPFEDALIEIRAEATANGFRGKSLEVTLSDGNGKVLDKREIKATSKQFSQMVEFETKPYKLGPQFFRVEVSLAQSQNALEEITENNAGEIVINRRPTPYRVLYVAGRPNWDHKFLQRALEEDRQVELVSLLRIANRAPKFEFRGRSGGAANPLFDGFKEDDEETRFDEPVFVRLNVKSSNELENGLPSLREELFTYDAVILDDIEAEFFGPDQSDLIDEFVRERGGGLLMLGGLESFHDGGYDRTTIGDLLPVTLSNASGTSPDDEHRLAYSNEGILQPWMRLRTRKAEEEERIAEMRAFRVLNRSGATRPGASLFAVVEDRSENGVPAVAGHRVGNGKVAALLIGDLWRWGLGDKATSRDRDQFWRQIVRWLVADAPSRLELDIEEQATAGSGKSIEVDVEARDAEFNPDPTAKVSVMLIQPDGDTEAVPLQIDFDESGHFTGTIPGLPDGRYITTATLADEESAVTDETGLVVDTARAEYRAPGGDRMLLGRIAEETGGELVPADQLDAFVQSTQQKDAPIMTTVSLPLWHQTWIFLGAILFLAAEWFIRRRSGMA